jgi:DNA primase
MRITTEYIASQPFEIVSNGREIRMNCPNCSDTTKHLYVNQDRQAYYCFKCGEGGTIQRNSEPSLEQFNLFDFKTQFTKTQVQQQKEVYKELTKPNVIKSLPPNQCIENRLYAEECESSEEYKAYTYLHKRGISQKEIDTYSIRVSTDKHGQYKNSIIFPITRSDMDIGMVEYFVCRKYDKSEPKYVNAPWAKDDTLFVTKGPAKSIGVIVEGIFDAIAIARIGYVGIALLGKKATSQQLGRLSHMYQRYIIYLDDDALSHAIQLKLQLNTLGNEATIVTLDKDAADIYVENPNILKQVIEHARQ